MSGSQPIRHSGCTEVKLRGLKGVEAAMQNLIRVVGLWFGVWASGAWATTVRQMSLEELFLGSDLFALVECEVSGEIVSEYRVIESWKGAKTGSLVRIRTPPNVWGPRIPTSLVGEQSIVAAYVSPPSVMMSTTSGPGDPTWWRGVKYDYSLPLMQGAETGPFLAVPPSREKRDLFGSGAESLEALRKLLEPWTALTVVQQRLKLLRMYADGDSTPPAFQQGLASVTTLEAAADLIFELDAAGDGGVDRYVLAMLSRALPREEVLAAVQRRSEPKRGALAKRWIESDSKPPERDVMQLRMALENPDSEDFDAALDQLPKTDCTFVADWIIKKSELLHEAGYLIGASFAHSCGTDRVVNLTRVAKNADEPFVRTAAAIGLSFDDEKPALELLKQLARDESDAGVWASLALARRGDKSIMPRLLNLLAGTKMKKERGDRWHHNDFKVRVQVLLSNSAKRSKVVAPPGDPAKTAAWWKKVQAKIELSDPWLEELKALRAD